VGPIEVLDVASGTETYGVILAERHERIRRKEKKFTPKNIEETVLNTLRVHNQYLV
jgi:hypothetical protein